MNFNNVAFLNNKTLSIMQLNVCPYHFDVI